MLLLVICIYNYLFQHYQPMKQILHQYLPYQPVNFIKTSTIGSTAPNNSSNIHKFNFVFQDLLQPKPGVNLIQYVLFHTAPIYNWIRTVSCYQRQILNNYIKSPKECKRSKIGLDINIFTNMLKQFSRKYQVVKQCICRKVYVKALKNTKADCSEKLLKTNLWTFDYQLIDNNLATISITCPNCNQRHDGEFISNTINLFSPILRQFYGLQTQIGFEKYSLRILIVKRNSLTVIFIKAANGLWYRIDSQQKCSITSVNKVLEQSKHGIFYIYNKNDENNSIKILQAAKPIRQQQQATKNKQKKIVKEDQFSSKIICIEKPKQKTQKPIAFDSVSDPLAPLKKQDIKVILSKDDQLGLKKYVSNVENLLDKEQQKDEYNKQYDKGKTKKIKKKTVYKLPNFNQIFQQVKSQQAQINAIESPFNQLHKKPKHQSRKFRKPNKFTHQKLQF